MDLSGFVGDAQTAYKAMSDKVQEFRRRSFRRGWLRHFALDPLKHLQAEILLRGKPFW